VYLLSCGARQDLRGAGLLDHLAVLHHQHLVADEAHHRQVVADEDIGQAEIVLQVLQQVEHLGLHRDVQRAHRLVEHQHLGVQRQAARDGHALALAAGELVRVLAEGRPSRPTFSSRARARCSRSAVSPMPWMAHRLDQRLADGEARVQAGVGVLEHDLDAPAHLLALAPLSASRFGRRR
jgi:hypothetical protein